MGALLKPEAIHADTSSYTDELREFFEIYGLHCGRPEDLTALADKLAAPGTFGEDMYSMIRSIVFREGGAITQVELLGLISLAIGGPQVDQSAAELADPIRKILAFLGGVLRTSWGMSESKSAPESPTFAPAEEAALAQHATEAAAVPALAGPAEVLAAYPGIEPLRIPPQASQPKPEIYFRARAMHSPAKTFDTAENLREFPAPIYTEPATEAVTKSAKTPASTPAWLAASWLSTHRTAWVAGLCLAAAAVCAAVILHNRPHVDGVANATLQKETDPVVTPYYPAATPAPKPTPYGQPARKGRAAIAGTPVKVASTTVAAPPVHDAYSPAAAVPTPAPAVTTAATGQPPAPIFRVTPFRDSPTAPVPVTPAASEPEGAVRAGSAPHAWRAPVYTRDGSLSISPGVMAGRLISAPQPQYPKLASLTHTQGKVVVQEVVGRDGTVISAHAVDGHRLLRGAATDAVRHWRYHPYMLNGRPMTVATVVTVDVHRNQLER